MDERDFEKFEFKICFVGIFYIAQPPDFECTADILQNSFKGELFGVHFEYLWYVTVI